MTYNVILQISIFIIWVTKQYAFYCFVIQITNIFWLDGITIKRRQIDTKIYTGLYTENWQFKVYSFFALDA